MEDISKGVEENSEECEGIISKVYVKMLEDSKEMEPEFAEILDEVFHDIL